MGYNKIMIKDTETTKPTTDELEELARVEKENSGGLSISALLKTQDEKLVDKNREES